MKKLLALDGIFEGGRMFVGATSVAYLLSQGISLRQVALLKSIQAVTLFAGEIPTGIIADQFGRRTSLLLALLISIIGFIAFFLGGSFSALVMAEICTALGLCFWSGAYEAFAIDQGNLLETAGSLDSFFHTNQTVNKLAVLFSGLIGGWIGSNGLRFPYLAAAASFLIAALILFLTKEERQSEPQPRFSITLQLSSVGDCIANTPGIRFWLLAVILVQFSIQPILHYWQPFFLELSPSITPLKLGWIFSGYCAVSAGFSWVYARLARRDFFRKPAATGMLFLLFSLLYSALAWTHGVIGVALIFFILQGVLGVARTNLAVKINSLLPSKNRATMLSSVSLVSRIGMIVALWAISATGTNNSGSLPGLFQGFAVGSLILTALMSIAFLGLQMKQARLAVISAIIGLQCWASLSPQITYPFSPYKMFSKNWQSGIIMDQVRYEDDQEMTYRPWDLLRIPFFQANQLSYVTFLDSAPVTQKQALCRLLLKSLSSSRKIKVLGSEIHFDRSLNGTMIAQESKKEVVYVCER